MKDLALLAALMTAAAICFYRFGYRAGSLRERRFWKAVVEQPPAVSTNADEEELHESGTPDQSVCCGYVGEKVVIRGQLAFFSHEDVRGAFGKN